MMALISTGQAARLLGTTRQTILNYIRDGKLEAEQTPGGHWRIEESLVKAKRCVDRLKAALE